MRTFFSALSMLLAVVLAAISVPALWLDRNVADEAGFVRLLSPMSHDADLQSSLIANLDSAVVSNTGIPPAVRPLAQAAIKALGDSLVSDPGFPAAWDETLRLSHQLNFTPSTASSNAFELQLRPLADLLVKKLGGALGADLPGLPSLTVQVGTPQQRSWLTSAEDLARLAAPLALGALLAFVLGLLFARNRGVALAWAGLGLLVVAAVFELGSGLVPSAASAQGSSGSMSSTFGARAAQLAVESFGPWIVWMAICGGVLLVAGALFGAMRRIRRSRAGDRGAIASMES